MGRHRTPEEKRALGERAAALRAAGRSRREICRELGIGDDLARALLRDVPLPDALRRPRAKDDVREAAVVMRLAGRTYDDIAAELGVSKSTCSLWLRDLPHPEPDAAAVDRRLEALRARSRRVQVEREVARQAVRRRAAEQLGDITPRDLVIAFAVSYWCEGAKRKPWNNTEAIRWMNSDPSLVSLFLLGLEELGVERHRLVLRLHIHETGDETTAKAFWSAHTEIPLSQFGATTIKRHNPKTVRHNTGVEYRGCLSIEVRRSRELYQVVDGLLHGLLARPRRDGRWHDGPAQAADRSRSAVG